MFMGKYDIDFKSMSVEEINAKLMSLDNEYTSKRDKIVTLVGDLEKLDEAYNKGKKELSNRNVLNNG